MATRSTIMDTNSFRPEMAAALDPETRKLTEERDVLGPAYRLFYRNPVHLVKGRGSHLWDADGEEYLDVYNSRIRRPLSPARGGCTYPAGFDAQHPHALPA